MDSATTPANADRPRPSTFVKHEFLTPDELQPRRSYDPARLQELAESMAPPIGIIEPLIVRPQVAGKQGFRIIAGERRWRAAKLAGLTEVPVLVRDLTDVQVIALQVIENHQREDIHPLEEALAIERWMTFDRTLTTASIAKTLGVSERTVQNKLRYQTLTPEAQSRFLKGEFTSGHADLLIRLSAADQARALKDGLYGMRWDDDVEKNVPELRSVRGLDEWLKHHVRLKPVDALQTGLFPELQEVAGTEGNATAVATLVELVDSYIWQGPKGEKAPLVSPQWEALKKGETCEHAVRGVIVQGSGQGRVLTVCIGVGKCRKHFPDSMPRPESKHLPAKAGKTAKPGAPAKPVKKSATELKYEREAEKRRNDAELWELAKDPVRKALVTAAAKAKPTPAVVQLISDDIGFGKVKSFGDLVVQIVSTGTHQLSHAVDAAKALGVNLKPLLQAAAQTHADGVKPVKKATPAKKKPARTFLMKTASPGTKKAFAPKKKPAKKGGKKK